MASHQVIIRRADPKQPADAQELAALAAAVFPLACPPQTTEADIAEHIATELSPAAFEAAERLPGVVFHMATAGGQTIGYTMLVGDEVAPVELPGDLAHGRTVELRRIYVSPDWHGGEVADRLMEAVLRHSRTHGYEVMWLGTNQLNERAIRFYRRQGFEVVGDKTFTVGSSVECDHVLARRVNATLDPTG